MTNPHPLVDTERLLSELGWVRALAGTLVRDPGLADDAAQEAWLLLRQRPPRTQSERGLHAWLARVTRTLVRSRLRSEHARSRREDATRRPENSAPSAHEVVARTELQQRVVAAVMALDEPYRSAVLLRHVEGLSAHEIGVRQGTSAENARQRVSRGLAQLRGALDREYGGERRAWVLALAGFLRDSGGGAAATFLGGTLAMKSSSWFAAALLGAVLVVAWFARGPHETPEPRAALASAAPELVATPPLEERPLRSAPESEGRSARVEPAPTPAARWLVRARLVDAHGQPLSGAVLALAEHDEPVERFSARSGADGAVELALTGELPLRHDPYNGALLAFVARAEGCGDALRLEPPPGDESSGAVLELGELRLHPIGALAGIVLDGVGSAVPGAEVRLSLPSVGQDSRERAELFGPQYTLGERRTVADEGGRFVFEDVAEGAWRAWAGAPGMRWGASEPLRVERTTAAEIELVLAPLPEASLVRGLVLADDGEALAQVSIAATPAGASVAQSYALSDAQGRFALAVTPGQSYRLHAREEAGRARVPKHGPASLDGVRGGGAEVVLVLDAARWLALEVVDRDGAPRDADVTAIYGVPEERDFFAMPERGRARVLVPDSPFRVRVAAEGFATRMLGPLEPANTPASLRVVLEPLARVRGKVTRGGRPVSGAIVQLVRLARGGEIAYLDGFPARLDGTELAGTTSDEDGRFELPIGLAAEYALWAEKDGYPAGERGPLALDPEHDAELDLELPQGGAVEGRVLVAEGESPAGILVKLCRGDMRVHAAVTDAEGAYHLAELTPGPFMVQAQRKRVGAVQGFAAAPIEVVHAEDFRFPWALEVRAGETVRYDIDLAEQELGTLAGFLRVDGVAPPAATVRLLRASEPWSVRPFDAEEQSLASDGGFAFEPQRTEAYWLVFELGAGTRVVRALMLERNENRVELELASASVRGQLPVGESGPFALVTELGPETFAVTPIEAGAGSFALAGVPAAPRAKLVAWRAGCERSDPRTWTELAHCAPAAGRVTELE